MLQSRFVLSLLVGTVASLSLNAQEADLSWKFKKDATFYQTMTTRTEQTMKVQGTDVVQNQSQTFYFSWTPTDDVKADKITLKQKIIGLKMSIDIGGSKISYDSTTKENPMGTTNPLNKFFEALNDATFTVTLNTKDMKVTDITGHEEFVKKLSDANPQMKPLLERILSKKALQDMAEPIFAALPGKKVAKSNEWKSETNLDMGPLGSYSTTYKYKYDGADKDKNEKILVTTELKYKAPDEKAGGNLPFKIKSAELKGQDGTGEVIYDPKTGMVKASKMSQTLTGTLDIEIGQQNTPVQLTQKQSTDILTSDKNPVAK